MKDGVPKTSIIKGHNKLCLFGVSLNIRFLIIFFVPFKREFTKKQPHKNVTQKQTILEKKNEIYQMNDLMLLT